MFVIARLFHSGVLILEKRTFTMKSWVMFAIVQLAAVSAKHDIIPNSSSQLFNPIANHDRSKNDESNDNHDYDCENKNFHVPFNLVVELVCINSNNTRKIAKIIFRCFCAQGVYKSLGILNYRVFIFIFLENEMFFCK